MAKSIKVFILKHESGKSIAVRVKTATARYMYALIEDYVNLGIFPSCNVTWSEVK